MFQTKYPWLIVENVSDQNFKIMIPQTLEINLIYAYSI